MTDTITVIEVTEFGTVDVLQPAARPRPEPGPGEVRIDVRAAGINYADVVQRLGAYPGGPEPPFVPGMEAAGVIDATGPKTRFEVGDHVVAMVGRGGYAESVVVRESRLFRVPDSTSFAEAAAFPVQFLTAYNCLVDWGGLDVGERVLIHAAAGGVGSAAVQLADDEGATVFATASTQAKLDLASDLGADHTINYTDEDFAARVNDLTDGEGVDLVLDGVGGETFSDSLDCLAHFGRIVAYGAASGMPGSVDTATLLFQNHRVIGFHLGQAMARDPDRVLRGVPIIEDLVEDREVELLVGHEFALEDAADAHEAIENRETTGKVVLIP